MSFAIYHIFDVLVFLVKLRRKQKYFLCLLFYHHEKKYMQIKKTDFKNFFSLCPGWFHSFMTCLVSICDLGQTGIYTCQAHHIEEHDRVKAEN